jgi:hypothetical protein
MRVRGASVLLRLMREEGGQAFAVLGLGIFLLIGLAGVAIEVGHGYYALEMLRASTDAAALAAAAGLPSATTAQAYADRYSSMANQSNRAGMLQSVTVTVTPYCSTNVASAYGVPCEPDAIGDPAYNAVHVVQTASTPTWFGRFKWFGIMGNTPLFNLTATGTAAMAGGGLPPYNIAVVMDTTASMGHADTTGCGGTQESCALAGFRQLLGIASPCGTNQSCTSGSPSPDDAIGLFVFPPILTSSVGADTDCSSSSPTAQKYTVPTLPTSPATTYQVIPFSGGATYRTSDSQPPTSLNTTDPLVIAAGGGCGPGLGTPGGAGTYYAQAIYAAQAALVGAQAARPGSYNMMIILSDGNATASAQKGDIVPSTGSGTKSSLHGGSDPNNSDNGSGTNGDNLATYPSNLGECGQAVQAAYNVGNVASYNNSGSFTQVYTIAYGAPNTSGSSTSKTEGCATDITTTLSISQPTGGGIWPGATGTGEAAAGITPKSPCAALAAMASLNAKPGGGGTGLPNFYSDASASPACTSSNPVNSQYTTLNGIFGSIIINLERPKLIPNGTS